MNIRVCCAQAQSSAETGEESAFASKNLAMTSFHLAKIQVQVGERKGIEHYFYKEVGPLRETHLKFCLYISYTYYKT